MYFLLSLLITFYFGITDSILFHYDETKSKQFYYFCKYSIISLCLTIIANNIFNYTRFFEDQFNTKTFLTFLLINSLVVFIIDGFVFNKIQVYVEQQNILKLSNLKYRNISLIIAIIGFLFITVTDFCIYSFGATTIEQMIINMIGNKSGTSTSVIIDIVVKPIVYTIILTVFFCLINYSKHSITLKSKKADINLTNDKKCRITARVLAILFVIIGVSNTINEFSVYKLPKIFFVESDYIETNYIDPKNTNLEFPSKKRNLIHIYLESVENTYFSKELGGNMDDNLMPDLAQLTTEGYSFSHQNNKFGGFQSSTGGQWSVASMINMYSGLPMKVPSTLHYYNSEETYFPNTTMLGDILNNQGYEQSVMFGSDSNFGGLIHLYTVHGNYKMIDLNTVKNEGKLPNNYHVWWGFEDDKLYDYAKEEITRLSSTGKPFNFTMETADTHFPDGYKSKNVEDEYESQYANVIKYSQEQTVDFIRWIQEQPFYENTTIVITGDHLSMDYTFFKKYVDKDYNRTVYNLILNPDSSLNNTPIERFYNRDWANFDMFPTILSSLGVKIEGNKLGLGTNLFSQEQTLFERDGITFVNNELEKHSKFYNDTIAVTR